MTDNIDLSVLHRLRTDLPQDVLLYRRRRCPTRCAGSRRRPHRAEAASPTIAGVGARRRSPSVASTWWRRGSRTGRREWAADWRAKLSTTYSLPLIMIFDGEDVGYWDLPSAAGRDRPCTTPSPMTWASTSGGRGAQDAKSSARCSARWPATCWTPAPTVMWWSSALGLERAGPPGRAGAAVSTGEWQQRADRRATVPGPTVRWTSIRLLGTPRTATLRSDAASPTPEPAPLSKVGSSAGFPRDRAIHPRIDTYTPTPELWCPVSPRPTRPDPARPDPVWALAVAPDLC